MKDTNDAKSQEDILRSYYAAIKPREPSLG